MQARAGEAATRPDALDFHPLEIIPFFRRWPHGPIRDVVYTFIWNCLVGGGFWMIGAMFRPAAMTGSSLASNLIVANTIGYTMHAMFFLTHRMGLDRWARCRGQAFTAFYYTVHSTIGVAAGFLIVALAFDPRALGWILQPRWLVSMAFSSAVISTVIAFVYFSRERQARAEADVERERLRAERVEREATLANLRALQAQIEPHFLFNTLANVAGLIDPDPPKARHMLESFIRFLRASLAATRSDRTTLADEAVLMGAYLDVLQVRMGTRLRYRIDIPPALGSFGLPPMLLQPVVENAIRHGLEPQVEGGEVAIVARREAAHVEIEIRDTGAGFPPAVAGDGVGLTNLRERLRLLFGGNASLRIAENVPRGTRVVVALPA